MSHLGHNRILFNLDLNDNEENSIAIVVLFCVHTINACDNAEQVIYNGVPWFDTVGNIVNAHGACVVEETWLFLFGRHSDIQLAVHICFPVEKRRKDHLHIYG